MVFRLKEVAHGTSLTITRKKKEEAYNAIKRAR